MATANEWAGLGSNLDSLALDGWIDGLAMSFESLDPTALRERSKMVDLKVANPKIGPLAKEFIKRAIDQGAPRQTDDVKMQFEKDLAPFINEVDAALEALSVTLSTL